MVAMDRLGGRNAIEVALGHSVVISAYIQYKWWEAIYFLDYEDPSFPKSREKFGRFCGVAENCGDLLTFKVYVPATNTIINRSVVRSAKEDNGNPNLRAMNPHYSGEPIEPTSIHSLSSDSDNSNSINDIDIPVIISSEDIARDDSRLENATKEMNIPDPDDLVGFTFPHEHKDVIQKAVVVGNCEDSDSYLIDLMDGSRATIEYNLLLEKFNESNEEGDQGMIQNCSMLSSQLVKKKHNAIAYHRIRESVAAGIIKMGHVSSEKNLSDICTKALPGPALHRLSKELLFRK